MNHLLRRASFSDAWVFAEAAGTGSPTTLLGAHSPFADSLLDIYQVDDQRVRRDTSTEQVSKIQLLLRRGPHVPNPVGIHFDGQDRLIWINSDSSPAPQEGREQIAASVACTLWQARRPH